MNMEVYGTNECGSSNIRMQQILDENVERVVVLVLGVVCVADLKLSTVADGDGLLRLAALRTEWFNLLDHIHTFDDGTEYNVTVVQPWGLHGGNEELGTVGVWSGVGLLSHNKNQKKSEERTIWLEKLGKNWNQKFEVKKPQKSEGAILTMDKMPGPVCFKLKFSSSNLFP